MYTAAALCMWFLRAWKIGELEQIAAETRKPVETLDAVTDQPPDLPPLDTTSRSESKSNFMTRMCMWRRV